MSERETTVLSKLAPKNLGNPKVAAAFDDGDQTVHPLGRIIGRASKVSRKPDPKDPDKLYVSLVGQFEGTPFDDDRPIIRSGVCYLPPGVHEEVVEAVEEMHRIWRDENPDSKLGPVGVVEFAFDIGTIKATNAAGYSYACTPVKTKAKEIDPFAQLRGDLKGTSFKLLEGPGKKKTAKKAA
jgi:hypothetical protein